MSTLALEAAEHHASGGGPPDDSGAAASRAPGRPLLRYPDLVLLALSAPVFVLADLPLLGYAAAAAAWLVQHAVLVIAERRSATALAAGNRRLAVGSIGAAVLVRVWVVTLAILLVGLLGEREDGLASAVLCLVLVTLHLGGQALSRALAPQPEASP